MNRRVLVRDLNPSLVCVLCGGYFIDATTIVECVHSFCRACIVKHFESSKYCPICEVMVHKTKPLLSLKRDKTLQDIVYKLVPDLFAREMSQRRQFYLERPHYVKPDDVESGGDVSDARKSYICDDSIALCLKYLGSDCAAWYLRCPFGVTIRHLKKLICCKYGFDQTKVLPEILLMDQILDGDLSLLDIACLFPYRSKEMLEFNFAMLEVKSSTDESTDKTFIPLETEKPSKCAMEVDQDPVQKEVQLQITEAGVMSVSEIGGCQNERHVLEQVVATPVPQPLQDHPQSGEPKHPPKAPVLPASAPPVTTATASVQPTTPRNTQSITPSTKSTSSSKTANPSIVSPITKPPTPQNPSATSNGKSNTHFSANSCKRDTVPTSSASILNVVKPQCPPISSTVSSLKDVRKRKASTEASAPKPKRPSISSDEINSNNHHKTSNSKIGSTSDISKNSLENPSLGQKIIQNFDKLVSQPSSSRILSSTDSKPKPVKPPPPLLPSQSKESPESKAPAPVNPISTPVATNSQTNKPPPQPPSQKPAKHKAIRSTPDPWRPVITKEKLRPTLMSGPEEPKKPGKFFKMRNMPRFLGNPASGVKPMYSNGLPQTSQSSPPKKVDQIVRVDPKTLRPIQKEEKKSPNMIMTNPFIPRDSKVMLPDPKTAPYAHFGPGFHASLPPSISLLLNPHQHFRNLKAREAAAAAAVASNKNCDTPNPGPSASDSDATETAIVAESPSDTAPPSVNCT